MRAGRAGYEKPTLVGDDGELRDVSIFLSEIDDALLSGAWPEAIAAIGPGQLPPVASGVRAAACLERPGRIFATEAAGVFAGVGAGAPRIGVKSGRPIGAQDDIVLPAIPHALCVNAGVAAVVGARSGDAPSLAGLCLFVNVFVDPAADLDPVTAMAVASAPSLLALGPYLASADDREPAVPLDLRLAVEGPLPFAGTGGCDAAQASRIVASVDRLLRLSVGDVVLVGGLAGCIPGTPPAPRVRAGDRILVDAGWLGRQAHACVAAA